MRRTISVFLLFFSPRLAADIIDDLPSGDWLEIPDSRLDAVAAPRLTGGNNGSNGVSAVMYAWSGGAFDAAGNRLIVWGGGHGDYSGNEVYSFDLDTFQWSRVSERSPDVGGDELHGLYPDGQPRSFHTMDNMEYVPAPVDRFCALRPSSTYPSAGGVLNGAVCFNMDTGAWTSMAPFPVPMWFDGGGSQGGSGVTAWDPARRVVWYAGVRDKRLYAWDPSAMQSPSAWTSYSSGDLEHFANGALGDDTFLVMRSYDGPETVVTAWNLIDPSSAGRRIDSLLSGDTGIYGANGPALEYDPIGRVFVGWHGDGDVYTLALMFDAQNQVSGGTWIRHVNEGAADPGSAQAHGTYGRFRYVPSKDVFIVANAVDRNLFVYRPGWRGGVPENQIPSRPQRLRQR